MAKIRAVVRDRQNGDPVASEDVNFRQPGGSVITTVVTDVNGMAEYEANGNPYGAITHDTTVSGDTRKAGAIGQRQIGAFFEAELPRSFVTVMSNGYGDGLGDECEVVPGSGRQVVVGTGCVWVQGIPFHFYDDTPLASTANPGTFATRLDRVILRVELDDTATDYGKGVLVYLEGTVNNTLPSITQDIAGTYEYVLANVTSASGFSSYTVGNISDQRAAAGPIAIGPAVQTALNLKANLASPTFTGTLAASVITATTVSTTAGITAGNGLTVSTGSVSLPDASLAIADTSGLQAALDAKAPSSSPTLTNPTLSGTVTVTDGALAIADTSGLQAALDAKAATTDVNTALAGKANDTGDTFTGPVIVTATNTSGLRVENGGGTDYVNINTSSPNFELVNGTDLTIYSGNYSGTVFSVDGATGNIGMHGATPVAQGPNLTDRSSASISTTTWGTGEAAVLTSLRTAFNELAAYLASRGDIADD